jgi:prolyl oligopeptidase
VIETQRAVDHLHLYSADGRYISTISDFGIVSIEGLATDTSASAAFVTVSGFDAPASLYRVSAVDGVTRWVPSAVAADALAPLAVSQVSYLSRGGASVGLFLVHRADITPSADTPAILTGYGGFAISETPVWSPTIAAWCAAGGLYAIAGLRGGLEEGQAWHHAGRRANKQNVFDDFHAAADFLVATARTSRDRLAIAGGSNGGLLVGAALTQRPDLCRAVWCAVPLLDMVRFPNFLIAQLWTDEYGDPNVAEEFEWLWAYSPYHHVVEGAAYPAVLLTTADGDTRVDPLHARKMAAQLQWAASSQGDRPILLTQQGRAGHGVGKPVSKRADEGADVLTFFSWQLSSRP